MHNVTAQYRKPISSTCVSIKLDITFSDDSPRRQTFGSNTYDALFEQYTGIDNTLVHHLRDNLRKMNSGCTVYCTLYDLFVS